MAENNLPGDFVDCGVWRGGNVILAAKIFQYYGCDNRVWAFDTFEGMTKPEIIDFSSYEGPALETWGSFTAVGETWLESKLPEVIQNFLDFKIDLNLVEFVRGKVEDTLLGPNVPEEISILRLDTDWYSSTKVELEVLFPLVKNGGIIMFDDYGYWEGHAKAIDESFQGSRPFLFRIDDICRLMIKHWKHQALNTS